MWRIIFLITCFVILCGVQFVEARPTACVDGEIHWCLSKKNAKRCHKEEHCQKIWNPVDVVIEVATESTTTTESYVPAGEEARHAIIRIG